MEPKNGQLLGEFRIMPEERARTLESAENAAAQLVMNGSAQMRALREQVAELKRALEYYAERKTWRPHGLAKHAPIDDDRGRRARKALGLP